MKTIKIKMYFTTSDYHGPKRIKIIEIQVPKRLKGIKKVVYIHNHYINDWVNEFLDQGYEEI